VGWRSPAEVQGDTGLRVVVTWSPVALILATLSHFQQGGGIAALRPSLASPLCAGELRVHKPGGLQVPLSLPRELTAACHLGGVP
jgi:hypothetical protein